MPIEMIPENPKLNLDGASRLNYAKIYTIEYNVKVKFIGRVHPDCGYQVAADYNSIHSSIDPPIGSNYLTKRESNFDGYNGLWQGGHQGQGQAVASSYSTGTNSYSGYNDQGQSTSGSHSQTFSYSQELPRSAYSITYANPHNTVATQDTNQNMLYPTDYRQLSTSLYPGPPQPEQVEERYHEGGEGGGGAYQEGEEGGRRGQSGNHDPPPPPQTSYDHYDDIYEE